MQEKVEEIKTNPPSEISTHDYENMCAVNINRELRGLRSWQGYLDIDAYLHDDSTVHDKRWEDTSSSGMSYRYEEDLDDELKSKPFIIDHNLLHPIFGPLEPIEEGSEESVISLNLNSPKNSMTSISTLVATIDEIRLGNVNSPLQYKNRENKIRRFKPGLTLDQILFLSELTPEA